MRSTTIITLLLLANVAFSQIALDIAPKSFELQNLKPLDNHTLFLDSLDYKQILEEDRNTVNSNRFAVAVPFKSNIKEDGQLTILSNGDKIWRLKIVLDNALALAAAYENFYIPRGAYLHMYNEQGKDIFGGYSNHNNSSSNQFFTGLVEGNTFILEYFEPRSTKVAGTIEIHTIYARYKTDLYYETEGISAFSSGEDNSAACHLDVSCYTAADTKIEIASHSTMRIRTASSAGLGYCSGALINNTRNDKTPFVLSAYHCQQAGIPNFAIYGFDFNYKTSSCGSRNLDARNASILGSQLVSRYRETDFLLLRLNRNVPESYCPTYAGWNRISQGYATSFSVHHPAGDIKKISFYDDPVTIYNGTINWDNTFTSQPNHHLGGYISRGYSEGGSSGSPLFNDRGEIVGQLHGGATSGCANWASSFYGRLALSWNGGGSASTRLRDHLDPSNTGANSLASLTSCIVAPTIEVSGKIYLDLNKSSIFEAGGSDLPVENLTIDFENQSTNEVLTTTTNAQGDYVIELSSNVNYKAILKFDTEQTESYSSSPTINTNLLGNQFIGDLERIFNSGYSDGALNAAIWDIKSPEITTKPASKDLNCGEQIDIPTLNDYEVSDISTIKSTSLDSNIVENGGTPSSKSYIFTAVDAFDNVVSDTVTFIFPSIPTVNIQSTSLELCGDKTSMLTANIVGGTSPFTYDWISGDGTFSSSASNETNFASTSDESFDVSILVIDAKGCIISDTTTIDTVINKVSLSIEGTTTYCLDEQIRLESSIEDERLRWSGPANSSSNTSTIQQEATLDNAGRYTLYLDHEVEACKVETSVEVGVIDNTNVEIRGSKTYCLGDTVSLSTGLQAGHVWTAPNNLGGNNETLEIPSDELGVGTHTIQISIQSGNCPVEGETEIEVIAPIGLTTSGDALLCPGNQITIETDGVNAVWTRPDGSETNGNQLSITDIKAADAGLYRVSSTNSQGCLLVDTVMIELKQIVDLAPSLDSLSCDGTIMLLSEPADVDSYSWTVDQTTKDGKQVTFENLSPNTNYVATLTTVQDGCTVEAQDTFKTFEPVNLALETTQKACEEENGKIEIQNVPNDVNLLWADNQSTEATRNNLGEGTYTVVASREACSYSFSSTIDNGCNPTLDGLLFVDFNSNSQYDEGEYLLKDAPIDLFYQGELSSVQSITTDENGAFSFEMEQGVSFSIKIDLINEFSTLQLPTYLFDADGFSSYIPVIEGQYSYAINIPLGDTVGPTIEQTPTDKNFTCQTYEPLENPIASDLYEIESTSRDSIIYGDASKPDSIKYTWTFTDKSGNETSISRSAYFDYSLSVVAEPMVVDLCENNTLTPVLSIENNPENLAYTWTFNEETSTATEAAFSIEEPGNYTVGYTVEGDFQCNAEGTIDVEVVKNDGSIEIIGDPNVCIGDSIKLEILGSDNVSWMQPSGIPVTEPTIAMAYDSAYQLGEYLAVGVYGIYCYDRKRITVREKSQGEWLDIQGEKTYCLGDTIELQTEKSNILWAVNNRQIETSNLVLNSALYGSGDLRIEAKTNTQSCVDSGTTQVTILPAPNFDLPDAKEFCEGQEVEVSVQNIQDYAWSGPANYATANTPLLIENATQNLSGLYILTAHDEDGCLGKDSIGIEIKPCFTGADVDGDYIGDNEDIDNDNDGIPDFLEGTDDLDGDGIPNYLDQDSDGDGISDLIEGGFSDPYAFIDINRDGLNDIFATQKLIPTDIDGDGMPNAYDLDSDGDGIPDIVESRATNQLTPSTEVDEDQDGFKDVFKLQSKIYYAPMDTDFDGIPDFVDTDSDGDGIADKVEAFDTDFDLIPNKNSWNEDMDEDGMDDAFDTQIGFGTDIQREYPMATDSRKWLFRDFSPNDLAVNLFKGEVYEKCFGLKTSMLIDYNLSFVNESVDGSCIKIEALNEGIGFNRMIACSGESCDTTYIRILVKSPTTDTIYADFDANNQAIVCLDASEVGQNPILEKVCDDAVEDLEEVEITNDFCIKYEGTTKEKVKQCYVLCSESVCDTFVILFNETVIDAKDDMFTVKAGKITTLDPLENDKFPIDATFSITQEPLYGTASWDGKKLLYESNEQRECKQQDTLVYTITHGNKKANGTLIVTLNCKKITINNGFSPNGDGINDAFIIEDIQNYPENRVLIFNKDGNLVFAKEGYSNDDPWKGNTKGNDLPDGIYYYIIHLNNKIKTFYSGSLVLFRG